MSNDKQRFEQRCAELRDAAAAVDVFQRSSPKGGFETVTIHVHANDDEDCIARFDVPVGAVNEFCKTNVLAVELAERITDTLETITSGVGAITLGNGRINNGGYRDGGLA